MTDQKDLKNKMSSTYKIYKSVQAIEKISAIKKNLHQNMVDNLNYYIKLLSDISINISDDLHNNTDKNESILLIFGNNRGLCGSLNSNMVNAVSRVGADFKEVWVSGKRTYVCLTQYLNNLEYVDISDKQSRYISDVKSLYNKIACYKKSVFICKSYNNFALSNLITTFDKNNVIVEQHNFVSLLIHLVKTMLFENASRYMAMAQACQACDELIEDLKVKINRYRQERITRDLMDITR